MIPKTVKDNILTLFRINILFWGNLIRRSSIIGEYQYKSAFVADQEINLVAFLTEIMMQCQFK